jgi:hypothetical protein
MLGSNKKRRKSALVTFAQTNGIANEIQGPTAPETQLCDEWRDAQSRRRDASRQQQWHLNRGGSRPRAGRFQIYFLFFRRKQKYIISPMFWIRRHDNYLRCWCHIVIFLWLASLCNATKNNCLLLSDDGTCSTNLKTSWPECVEERLSCEQCELLIRKERSDLQTVLVIPFGSLVTMDYSVHRVRIFCQDGYVHKAPTIG